MAILLATKIGESSRPALRASTLGGVGFSVESICGATALLVMKPAFSYRKANSCPVSNEKYICLRSDWLKNGRYTIFVPKAVRYRYFVISLLRAVAMQSDIFQQHHGVMSNFALRDNHLDF